MPILAGASSTAEPHGAAAWLRERRLKIALILAGAEAVLVALSSHVSAVGVVVFAALVIGAWVLRGHELRPGLVREVAWTLALSQALAVVAVVVALLVGAIALVVAALFAVAVIALLLMDRRGA